MPKKDLIIIGKSSCIDKYLHYKTSNTKIVTWNPQVSSDLNKRKIDHYFFKSNYQKSTGFKWIKKLARKKFHKSQDLRSILQFEDTSLWWWMECWLYSSSVYYNSFEDIIRTVHTILDVIKKEKPTGLVYLHDGDLLGEALSLIAPQLGLESNIINQRSKFVIHKLKRFSRIKLIKLFLDSRFQFRKYILTQIFRLDKYNTSKITSKTALFIYSLGPRQKKYINPIIQNVDSKEYNKIVADNTCGKIFFSYATLKEKLQNISFKNVILESYLKKGDIRCVKNQIRRFKFIKNKLITSLKFKELFNFNELYLWPLFEPQFCCYFNLRLKHHLLEFKAAHRIIQYLKPYVVITPAETTEFDKGLFLACQKRNIPTIAIQHGIVAYLRCIHQKGEVSLNKITPKHCPIPTITAVYGAKDKEFLVNKGNYPPKSVVVTGNPRYDLLINQMGGFNKNDICNSFGLNPKEKIIVFATDNLPSLKDREIVFRAVSDAIKNIKNMQLIIKVHPSESLRYNQKLAKKNGINCLITKENVNKILYICDTLLFVTSTIGLEAAIFNKPIIILNVSSSLRYTDYVEKNIAIEANNSKELEKSIYSLLYNTKLQKKLAKNRTKYIYEHCFKVDGRASERVARLIQKLSNLPK